MLREAGEQRGLHAWPSIRAREIGMTGCNDRKCAHANVELVVGCGVLPVLVAVVQLVLVKWVE
jgi:hypothetical protein